MLFRCTPEYSGIFQSIPEYSRILGGKLIIEQYGRLERRHPLSHLLLFPPADDPVKPVKCSRRHEQDVGGVDGYALAPQLARAPLRDIDNGPL